MTNLKIHLAYFLPIQPFHYAVKELSLDFSI